MAVRRLPLGAELSPSGGGVHFRVWAPKCRRVEVATDRGHTALEPEADGYFSGAVSDLRAGSRYSFRLDGGESRPDPASRYQPEGVHGPSQVIDPQAHVTDQQGRPFVVSTGKLISALLG